MNSFASGRTTASARLRARAWASLSPPKTAGPVVCPPNTGARGATRTPFAGPPWLGSRAFTTRNSATTPTTAEAHASRRRRLGDASHPTRASSRIVQSVRPLTDLASADSQGGAFSGPTTGGSLIWRRFRRDRFAFAGLVGLCVIVFACFVLEPLLERLLGHGPDEPFLAGADPIGHHPVPWFSWVANNDGHGKTFFLLGGDGPLGRDEFLRVLAGGQLSLEIALVATALALIVGVLLGTVAGYYGGVLDAVISRVTEL